MTQSAAMSASLPRRAYLQELAFSPAINLSTSARALIGALAYHDYGHAIFPGMERLAACMGASVSTVQRATRELQRAGLLLIHKRGRRKVYDLSLLERAAKQVKLTPIPVKLTSENESIPVKLTSEEPKKNLKEPKKKRSARGSEEPPRPPSSPEEKFLKSFEKLADISARGREPLPKNARKLARDIIASVGEVTATARLVEFEARPGSWYESKPFALFLYKRWLEARPNLRVSNETNVYTSPRNDSKKEPQELAFPVASRSHFEPARDIFKEPERKERKPLERLPEIPKEELYEPVHGSIMADLLHKMREATKRAKEES